MNRCTFDATLECRSDCSTGCFAEKVSSFQLSPKATPSKRSSAPPTWHQNRNSWENGVVRDARGVPLLDQKGSEIGVKQYAENRHTYETRRRELASSPTPFKE